MQYNYYSAFPVNISAPPDPDAIPRLPSSGHRIAQLNALLEVRNPTFAWLDKLSTLIDTLADLDHAREHQSDLAEARLRVARGYLSMSPPPISLAVHQAELCGRCLEDHGLESLTEPEKKIYRDHLLFLAEADLQARDREYGTPYFDRALDMIDGEHAAASDEALEAIFKRLGELVEHQAPVEVSLVEIQRYRVRCEMRKNLDRQQFDGDTIETAVRELIESRMDCASSAKYLAIAKTAAEYWKQLETRPYAEYLATYLWERLEDSSEVRADILETGAYWVSAAVRSEGTPAVRARIDRVLELGAPMLHYLRDALKVIYDQMERCVVGIEPLEATVLGRTIYLMSAKAFPDDKPFLFNTLSLRGQAYVRLDQSPVAERIFREALLLCDPQSRFEGAMEVQLATACFLGNPAGPERTESVRDHAGKGRDILEKFGVRWRRPLRTAYELLAEVEGEGDEGMSRMYRNAAELLRY